LSLRRGSDQDHAFAAWVGAAVGRPVAQEDAVEAAILALPAAQLDAAGAQSLDHGRRETGHLAAIIGPARDEVGEVDRVLR
jgi:hypothetical protein